LLSEANKIEEMLSLSVEPETRNDGFRGRGRWRAAQAVIHCGSKFAGRNTHIVLL